MTENDQSSRARHKSLGSDEIGNERNKFGTNNLIELYRPPSYPKDGSYADLLFWHLFVWGTRPGGSVTERGAHRWAEKEFRAKIFGKDSSPESEEKKYHYWLGEQAPYSPPGAGYWPSIAMALFGNEPQFEIWANDLDAARKRSKGRGNNVRRITLEQALKDLANAARLDSSDQANRQNHFIASLDQSVLTELGMRRDLLEVLAMRFGHNSPDAPDSALLGFLKKTAQEYHELKARIAELLENDEQLANVLGAAHAALDDGNFAEAEKMLSTAEESYQQKNTLVAIRHQAKIRIARGDACLIGDDLEGGAHHYMAAAKFFHHFDKWEEINNRIDLAKRLRNRSSRTSDSYEKAFEIIEPAEKLVEAGTIDWAIIQLRIGYCLCDTDDFSDSHLPEVCRRATRAIERFDCALAVLDEHEHALHHADINERYAWALSFLAKQYAVGKDEAQSISFFKRSLDHADRALKTFSMLEHPNEWLKVTDFSARVCLSLGSKSDFQDNEHYLDECISRLTHAFAEREFEKKWVIWINMAEIYIKAVGLIVELRGDHTLFGEAEAIIERERQIAEPSIEGQENWVETRLKHFLDMATKRH